METERNRSCKTGFNKSSTVDRRRSCIRSSSKRLLFQNEQEREESSSEICSDIKVQENKFIVVDELET